MRPSVRLFRTIAFGLLIASLVTSPVAGSHSFVGIESPEPTDTSTAPSIQSANNSSVQQENPSLVAEEDRSEDLERWLGSKLAGRLERSAESLDQDAYERATEFVGEDYGRQQAQYADVSGGSEEGPSAAFGAAGRNQADLAVAVASYRRTYDAYQDARQANETQRARDLARNLSTFAVQVNETGSALRANFDTITSSTSVGPDTNESITAANRTIGNVTRNVSERQSGVRAESFVATSLTLSTTTDAASFSDPLVVSGRLTAADGSSVAGENVTFVVNGRPITTDVDSGGRFRFEYRPTTIALNASSVTVQYVPNESSLFLGSKSSAGIDVTPVEPTVRLNRPPAVAYNDSLTISGSVGAAGVGAAGVPVTISLGGVPFATTTTTGNGSFNATELVPAAVPAGTQRVTATVSQRTRALTSADVNRPTRVRETRTMLNVTSARNGSQVRVFGRLSTAAGESIPNRTIAIELDGAPTATVETDRAGLYSVVVPVPGRVPDSGEVVVSASYDGANASLAPSRARTHFVHPNSAFGSVVLIERLAAAPPWLIGVVTFLLAALSYVPARRLLGADPGRRSDDGGGSAGGDLSGVPQMGHRSMERSDEIATALLATAEEHLDAGRTDVAVQMVYHSARTRLVGRYGLAPALTHWELFEACLDSDLSSDQIAALERVTRGYEVAAFAAEDVSTEGAAQVLDALDALFEPP